MIDRDMYWKVHEFIEKEGNIEFLNLFEALCFAYVWEPAMVDEFRKKFRYFYTEE